MPRDADYLRMLEREREREEHHAATPRDDRPRHAPVLHAVASEFIDLDVLHEDTRKVVFEAFDEARVIGVHEIRDAIKRALGERVSVATIRSACDRIEAPIVGGQFVLDKLAAM